MILRTGNGVAIPDLKFVFEQTQQRRPRHAVEQGDERTLIEAAEDAKRTTGMLQMSGTIGNEPQGQRPQFGVSFLTSDEGH